MVSWCFALRRFVFCCVTSASGFWMVLLWSPAVFCPFLPTKVIQKKKSPGVCQSALFLKFYIKIKKSYGKILAETSMIN